jgi:hypothetical protein
MAPYRKTLSTPTKTIAKLAKFQSPSHFEVDENVAQIEQILPSDDAVMTFSSQMPIEAQESEKYYKKFDFFYRRTAFRSMTEYYKVMFKPILDKWREGERKSTKNFVQQFICKNASLVGLKPRKDYKKLQSFMTQSGESSDFVAFKE